MHINFAELQRCNKWLYNHIAAFVTGGIF